MSSFFTSALAKIFPILAAQPSSTGSMLLASFSINASVAGTMAAWIWTDTKAATLTFGPDSVARQILGSIYFAIAAGSAVAAFMPAITAFRVGSVLLPLQILYKLTTLGSVTLARDAKNPVPWFNLGISAFHVVTLAIMSRNGVLYL